MKSTNTEDEEVESHFVVDVNIIFSGVLSRKGIYRKLFSEYKLYTPDFALIELSKYREIILKKARKINADDFRDFTFFIFSKIIVVPSYMISDESYNSAEKLLESIDKKDVAYLALAMELDLVLLTRDKILYEGLISKGFEKVKLFEDFVEDFSN
ncbi:MAG TPA: PIN domain-containing protein [Candidatus Deferrimicrobium sp.]|nr:PIN domain-containing protein [Candidatus Deferrimicrobium sp.]